RIAMPAKSAPVVVLLGWVSRGVSRVFQGTVDDVRASCARGGGRTLRISAKGFDDAEDKAKEPLEFHKDDATLQDFLGEAAKKAGLSFQAHGELGKVKRDYWLAGTESFIQLGHRIAREVGATFKIIDKKGVMVPRNGGQSASGASLSTVRAVWGDNLITADVAPIEIAPRFEQVRARWFDVEKAKWMEEKVGVEVPGWKSKATDTARVVRTDKDEAKDQTTSDKKTSEREAGSGTVKIVGEPSAQPEGLCVLVGARPGIDGAYRIDGVTHDLDRSSGFVTTLELKQPQSGAGTDSR
ncbi:phage late control D family protein, partial [Rhodoplanes sp. SY1]|uniref:phage late control D family protein n=1 Tax=Rhodoplanes sp. SY1 TaxID=3166646 RepID=UPI0038B57F97